MKRLLLLKWMCPVSRKPVMLLEGNVLLHRHTVTLKVVVPNLKWGFAFDPRHSSYPEVRRVSRFCSLWFQDHCKAHLRPIHAFSGLSSLHGTSGRCKNDLWRRLSSLDLCNTMASVAEAALICWIVSLKYQKWTQLHHFCNNSGTILSNRFDHKNFELFSAGGHSMCALS